VPGSNGGDEKQGILRVVWNNQILQNGMHFCCYNVISAGGNAFFIEGR
jgi:hypothetical protein